VVDVCGYGRSEKPGIRGRAVRRLISKILNIAVGLYMLALIVAVPYFNWQYAQEHGFMRWFFFGEFVATAKGFAWPYFVAMRFSPIEWKGEEKDNVRSVAEAPRRSTWTTSTSLRFSSPQTGSLRRILRRARLVRSA
jgi:hypothetical protein